MSQCMMLAANIHAILSEIDLYPRVHIDHQLVPLQTLINIQVKYEHLPTCSIECPFIDITASKQAVSTLTQYFHIDSVTIHRHHCF